MLDKQAFLIGYIDKANSLTKQAEGMYHVDPSRIPGIKDLPGFDATRQLLSKNLDPKTMSLLMQKLIPNTGKLPIRELLDSATKSNIPSASSLASTVLNPIKSKMGLGSKLGLGAAGLGGLAGLYALLGGSSGTEPAISPEVIQKAIAEVTPQVTPQVTPEAIMEASGGIPDWLKLLGGASALGLGGYGLYNMLSGSDEEENNKR